MSGFAGGLYLAASGSYFVHIPKCPKPISVREAFELIKLIPLGKRTKVLAKGNESLYMSYFEWTDDIISILINKSDKGISDPIFTIPKENKRRTAEKTEEEGQDFSSHIVIKLPNKDIDPALVIIEQCHGLSVSTIKELLDNIINDAKKISPDKFKQMHPDGSVDNDGNPKKYDVIFKSEFDGHISNELKDDLNHGKIRSIELITDKDQNTDFDEEGYVKEKCKTLVLTLKDNENNIANKYGRIVKLCKKEKNNYSHARIKLKTQSGLDRTVNMNTADGLVQHYVKKEKLDNFNYNLKSSYDKPDKSILDKMKKLLLLEHND
ncbi:conserved hypothetical protein [Bathymodiolus platifrons methanotrophic gill symbiont]|nr:conserved hypothetical protein [Bathymodiolus platifrons methanotrophic gill symbiont]